MSISNVVAGFYKTITSPDAWPDVLQEAAERCGAAGASCRVRNRITGEVWVRVSASYPAGMAEEYLNHYASFDLYTPRVADHPVGHWLSLSESISEDQLRQNEWYQDYVRKHGTADVYGIRLADFGPNTLIFSAQQAIDGPPIENSRLAEFEEDLQALAHSTLLRLEFDQLRTTSRARTIAIDQLGAAVILCDGRSRIVELNGAAEHLLQAGDGLIAQHGSLSARRHFEAARLQHLIATAAQPVASQAQSGRMLIARSVNNGPLIVSITPLGEDQTRLSEPSALILVRSTTDPAPPEEDLVELFGLSRAEARLAARLAEGDRLADIAAAFGVKVSTLRTQLGSILKKLNVDRQSDLARVLASIPRAPRQFALD